MFSTLGSRQVDASTSHVEGLQVVVGVLTRGSGEDREVFVTRRRADQHQGGLLEFPGGKCEAGESIELALARELREELGIVFNERTTLRPLIEIPWTYGSGSSLKRVHLHVQEVQHWIGEPRGMEAEEATWMKISELESKHFPAANRGIISALQAPIFIQITPDCPSGWKAIGELERPMAMSASLAGWLMSPRAQPLKGRLGILLRAKQLSPLEYAKQAARLQQQIFTEARGGRAVSLGIYLDHGQDGGLSAGDLRSWLQAFSVNAAGAQSVHRGAAFIHLSAVQCEYWTSRLDVECEPDKFYSRANEASASGGYGPLRKTLCLPDFCLMSASVHTPEALWQAVSLGVDQVFISPVAATQTHPDARPLGWSGFARINRDCPVPAFALGGLTEQDFDTAVYRGGQGIAAIRGFGFADNA